MRVTGPLTSISYDKITLDCRHRTLIVIGPVLGPPHDELHPAKELTGSGLRISLIVGNMKSEHTLHRPTTAERVCPAASATWTTAPEHSSERYAVRPSFPHVYACTWVCACACVGACVCKHMCACACLCVCVGVLDVGVYAHVANGLAYSNQKRIETAIVQTCSEPIAA